MHVWEAVNLRKKIVFHLSPLFLQQSFRKFLLSQIIHYQVKLWGEKKGLYIHSNCYLENAIAYYLSFK